MGLYLSWAEWKVLREDNARKRLKRQALNGLRTAQPGSLAACPGATDPRAMDIAKRTGVVGKNTKFRFEENDEMKPDYSFDRWLQKAKEFGDDVNKMVGKEKEDEEKFEKDAEDKKKKADEEDKKVEADKKKQEPETQEPDEPEVQKKKDEAWKRLQQIHQDRLNAAKTAADGKRGTPSTNSSPPSSKPPTH